jgi:hypothetical protein
MDYLQQVPMDVYTAAAGGVFSWFAYEGGSFGKLDTFTWRHAARAIPSRIVVAGAVGLVAAEVLPMLPIPAEIASYEIFLVGGGVFALYAFFPALIKPLIQAETFLYEKVFGAIITGN